MTEKTQDQFSLLNPSRASNNARGRMSTLGVVCLVSASVLYARSSRMHSGCCIYRVLGGHGACVEWRNQLQTTHVQGAMWNCNAVVGWGSGSVDPDHHPNQG